MKGFFLATRIYLLAMELNLDFQTVLTMAERKGIHVRSHLNALEPEEETLLRKAIEAEGPALAAKSAAAATAVLESVQPRQVEVVEGAPAAGAGASVPEVPVAAGAGVAAPGAEGGAGAVPVDWNVATARDKIKQIDEDDKKGTKRKDRRRGRRKLDGEEIIRKLRGSRFFESEEEVDTADDAVATAVSRLGLIKPSRRPARTPKRRLKSPLDTRGLPTMPPRDSTVIVDLPVTVKNLSQSLGIKAGEILGVLLQNEVKSTINSFLDQDAVELISIEFNREIRIRKAKSEDDIIGEEKAKYEQKPENLKPKPPVVTFLGHVDHGKTSLLDAIKMSNVQASEAGGITQHMAAYEVRYKDKIITFLDTPGHAAFTEMRARGAHVTDIVVLVVAADDGVMPQTEEALNHAKAAGVPIIIALNKVDLPNANVIKTKQQLATIGLLPEEFGGEAPLVETSAVKRTGINELLDLILILAEVNELKADTDGPAMGNVLEARLTEGMGVVATVLVRNGTLRKGDFILAGKATGRVRSLEDSLGKPVESAGPSIPVDVSGLDRVPEAGDTFIAAIDEEKAKSIARDRIATSETKETKLVSLENLFEAISAGKASEIPIIIKADVKGSIAPLKSQLEAFSTAEVKIKVLHSGVGAVTESDVLLAEASKALIIGFHVAFNERIRTLADEHKVDIKIYDIIYQAVDDIKKLVEGKHKPVEQEKVIGHAEVRKVFKLSKGGMVAGCFVTDGVVARKDFARVKRDGKVIQEKARISSLKRFHDDVKEVKDGFECGIKLSNFEGLRENDVVETYEIELIMRKLEDVKPSAQS